MTKDRLNEATRKGGLVLTPRDLAFLHLANIHLNEFEALPAAFYDDSIR